MAARPMIDPKPLTWRTRFPLAIATLFFALMAVGFSDNWWFNVGQPSNRDPKFLIHAFFALGWFSLLVVQTALVHRGNRIQHMRLGQLGLIAFVGMMVTTGYLYFELFVLRGVFRPLSIMVFTQLVVAALMITHAFLVRRTDRTGHREGMLIGSLLLMQPSIDRVVGHVFGSDQLAWLLIYLALFTAFAVYVRWRSWRLGLAFAAWLAGVLQFAVRMSAG